MPRIFLNTRADPHPQSHFAPPWPRPRSQESTHRVGGSSWACRSGCSKTRPVRSWEFCGLCACVSLTLTPVVNVRHGAISEERKRRITTKAAVRTLLLGTARRIISSHGEEGGAPGSVHPKRSDMIRGSGRAADAAGRAKRGTPVVQEDGRSWPRTLVAIFGLIARLFEKSRQAPTVRAMAPL